MHSPCLEVDLLLLTRVALLTAVNKATAYFNLFVKCFLKFNKYFCKKITRLISELGYFS